MDFAWIALIALLWALMVLMVWGFERLEPGEGGRP